ncbi:MAG: efflux RND transporter periplasmic adaptor subunit [Clostridia bacterium]|nr:efflux RND transporter periplasmic adaptor subunit [Clostridia bacterium]
MYLPFLCLYSEAEAYYVYRVVNNEMFKQFVEVGITNGSFIEIKSGIQEGDFVLKVK